MQSYGQVMKWNASNKHYLKQAKDEFAKFEVADAFLIAVAKAYGFTIVTHETSQPGS
jgi:predicted nucleic acid-binding protein